jgi:hypothetical protein
MATAGDTAQLDIGRVISRTFAATGANFFSFILLAIIFGGLPSVAAEYVLEVYVVPEIVYNGNSSSASLMVSLSRFAATLVLIIPSYIMIGAVTHGAIVHLNGGRASLGDCLGTGLGRSLPLVGLGIISTLGIGLAMLALIIPGLIVATRWCVAAPALVAERTGISESLGRSVELGRNNRWRIFWLFVLWFIMGYLLQLGVNAILPPLAQALYPLGQNGIWVFYGIIAIYAAFTSLIAAVGTAALYTELRTIKEGATSEELAKVFE